MENPIGLEINKAALAHAISASVAQAMYLTGGQVINDNVYLDHVDVSGKSTYKFDKKYNVFVVQIPINIFIVDITSLTKNSIPVDSKTPKGTGTIEVTLKQVEVSGKLKFYTDVPALQISSDEANPTLLWNIIISAVDNMGAFDLNDIVSYVNSLIPISQPDQPPPSATTASLQDNDTSLIFCTTTYKSSLCVSHLTGNQEWCLFISEETVTAVLWKIFDYFVKLFGASGNITTDSVMWAPISLEPNFDVKITGQSHDAFNDSTSDMFHISFTLYHAGAKGGLTILVSREKNDILDPILAQFYPPQINGIVPLGTYDCYVDKQLPTFQFGSCSLHPSNLIAENGLLITGTIMHPGMPDTKTLTVHSYPFPNIFTAIKFCDGPFLDKPDEVTASATAFFDNVGRFYSASFPVAHMNAEQLGLAVSKGLQIQQPPNTVGGTVMNSATITISTNAVAADVLNGALASNQYPSHTLQFYVSTSRGIRLIDVGAPPAKVFDQTDGNEINVSITYVNNCPVVIDPWWNFKIHNVHYRPDPPLGWWNSPEEVAVLQIHLVELKGLGSGDIVVLDAPMDGGSSFFIANASGHLAIPIVTPMRSTDAQTRLGRADGYPLAGVHRSSVLLRRVALLNTPGAFSHRIVAVKADAVHIETNYPDASIETVHLHRSGAVFRASAISHKASSRKWRDNIYGDIQKRSEGTLANEDTFFNKKPLPIPGFEDKHLHVRINPNNNQLVEIESGGHHRIYGILAMWPKLPAAVGNWILCSTGGDVVGIYHLERIATT